MGRVADTRYRTYPWDAPHGATGAYEAPYGEAEYAQTHDAIDTVTAPHDEIAMRGHGFDPVAPRYGYGAGRTTPGIRETLAAARLYPDQSRSLSGTEAGYTGSPRNQYGGGIGG